MNKRKELSLADRIIKKIDGILWYYFMDFTTTPDANAYNCAMAEIERYLKETLKDK